MSRERTGFKAPDWLVVGGQIIVIPDTSLARYLSQPHALETEHTIGDESNQLPKKPRGVFNKPSGSIVNDGSRLTVEQLVASVSRR
jgi:hypothetical protein